LHGCETWSLTLKEETSTRAYENMMLRKIFGPQMEEARGGGEESIKSSFKM
jgi:hypothetical protein